MLYVIIYGFLFYTRSSFLTPVYNIETLRSLVMGAGWIICTGMDGAFLGCLT